MRGAAASLVLAYVAQVFSRDLGIDALVLGAYLVAGVIFAVSDRVGGVEVRPERQETRPSSRPRALALAGAGVALALVLNLLAEMNVYDNLRAGGSSPVGPLLWAASLLVLLLIAVVVRPLPSWPAAWCARWLPESTRARRLLLAGLVLVIAGACVARLIALDRIPWGINADEGDRAASAVSLLDGTGARNFFANGWFYISNVYFWLLAGVLKVLGVGYAQARVLGAVSSILTLVVMVWIALRNFGSRVALLTAILGATLAVSLQFARETTEATPTALLWALSAAFLLEAVRTGGTWPWVAAGISGSLSLYFYPSGRLWVLFAAAACVYLAVRTRGARRWSVVAGVGVTALASALTLSPFLANTRAYPGELLLRARQTSIFYGDNKTRLEYYDPHWNTAQLLWAQLRHSFAIFANTGDGGGFWPTDRPILGATMTILVAVGLGWFTLSWRYPPRFVLALWFWVGFAGMVVTVETPNLQRMATAVPVLPLLAAAVIDATAVRFSSWARMGGPRVARAVAIGAGAAGLAVAATLAGQQAHFYFGTYKQMYRWPQPTMQGEAVAAQGRDTLVMSLSRESMQINSGWVRLLAPHIDRGGVQSPGTLLPLPLPATRNLAFLLYPGQEVYLPYLRTIYPGGSLRQYAYSTEGLIASVYRVPRSRVAARSGSLATTPDGRAVRVRTLGAVPSGVNGPTRMRWSAELHVPQHWDYSFRLSGGPAALRIDGKELIGLGPRRSRQAVTVALDRGRHFVTLDGAAGTSGGPRVMWRTPPGSGDLGPHGFETWRPVATGEIVPAAEPAGLFATMKDADGSTERRLDGTVATCCLTNDFGTGGRPYAVRWEGSLRVPKKGVYTLALFTQGIATLRLDGKPVIRSHVSSDWTTRIFLPLTAGRHAVDLRYRVDGTGGAIELTWAPPGQRERIVPPNAFEPPRGAGISPRVPLPALTAGPSPADVPLVVTS